jgi:5'-phosphate synthase pdxT subunit
MNVGVVGIQGDVSEHIASSKQALDELGYDGEVLWVRTVKELRMTDALIIPGGESTTISKYIVKNGLFDEIIDRARRGMPVMGTCAGCILLAREGDDSINKTGTKLLGLMDMSVQRNAFGRQKESCEISLHIEGIGKYHTVFIRAPAIDKVWSDCKPLAQFNEKIVMARQRNFLALAFHPELSGDARIHKMLIGMVRQPISEPVERANTKGEG